MPLDKITVLNQAPGALNRPDQPWYVTVEGDAIVGRWKWTDETSFSIGEVTKEIQEYTFTVILGDKGKYKEIDKTDEKSSGINMSNGKIGLGTSASTFKGKTNQKSFSFELGKDDKTGKLGVTVDKFDTTYVKQPIRAYLESCGWKKAGLFN